MQSNILSSRLFYACYGHSNAFLRRVLFNKKYFPLKFKVQHHQWLLVCAWVVDKCYKIQKKKKSQNKYDHNNQKKKSKIKLKYAGYSHINYYHVVVNVLHIVVICECGVNSFWKLFFFFFCFRQRVFSFPFMEIVIA